MGDSVSPPLAILARPGSAPLPNTRFPIVGCVGQSSGGVGTDTGQFGYKTTECSDRGVRRVRSGAYLSMFPSLTFPRSLPGRALHPDSVAWNRGSVCLFHIGNPTVFSLIRATCVGLLPIPN